MIDIKTFLVLFFSLVSVFIGFSQQGVTLEVQVKLNEYAKTISFETGKALIKNESISVMGDIVEILNEYPTVKFTVEGHTDKVGSAKTNQRISEERANSVRDFLIDKGITSDRLTAIGYGEDKPIATNNTRSGRNQNNRMEINVLTPDGIPGTYYMEVKLSSKSPKQNVVDGHYYRELDNFFRQYYSRFIKTAQFVNVDPGREIELRAVQAEITKRNNIRENIQIISILSNIENKPNNIVSLKIFFVVDGKWMRMNPAAGIPNFETLNTNGEDFDSSIYQNNVLAYAKKLYKEFEK